MYNIFWEKNENNNINKSYNWWGPFNGWGFFFYIYLGYWVKGFMN